MSASRNLMPRDWTIERSLAPLEPEWRALEAAGGATPFQGYDWVRLYHEIDGRDAVFAAGRQDGKLRIVLPLSLKNGVLTWFGEALSNYNMPLACPELLAGMTNEDVDAVWREVRVALGSPSASILRRQPAEVGGRPNPFAKWSAVTEPTSAYSLRLGTEWPSFYEGMHSAATRKMLRKKERWLGNEGEVSAGRIDDPRTAREYARLLMRWKSDQVDATGGRNTLACPANCEILERFASEHPDKASIYALTVAGRPVALAYRFERGRTPVLYQMAYAPGPTARFSPGRLLLNHVIESAIAEGSEILDLAVGDEPYKIEMCDQRLALTTSLAAHSPAGRFAVARERAKLGLKGVIKSNPVLLDLVLRMHAKAKSLAR